MSNTGYLTTTFDLTSIEKWQNEPYFAMTKGELVFVNKTVMTACLEVDSEQNVRLLGGTTVERNDDFNCGKRFSYLEGTLFFYKNNFIRTMSLKMGKNKNRKKKTIRKIRTI